MDVTVAAVARTAVRPVDGELAGWHPVALAGAVGGEALERAGLGPGDLDEVIVGCPDPVGACGADAARAVVLAAGWPAEVGGQVIDRGETSGLAAVQAAVAAIRAGQARTVLVLGVGVCSVVPPGAAALNRAYGAPWAGVAERLAERGGLLPAPRLAERAAAAAGIGRAELDAAAEESRRRRRTVAPSAAVVAVAAQPGDAAGPWTRRGDPVPDDALREWGDTAGLPPAFDEDGLLTAATFAPPADAVAAVLLQAEAAQAGPRPNPAQAAVRLQAQAAQLGPRPNPAQAAVRLQAQAAQAGPRPNPAQAGQGIEAARSTVLVTAATGRGLEAAASAAKATVEGVGRAAGDPHDPIGNVAMAVGRALEEAGVSLDAVDEIAVAEHDAATGLLVASALGIDATRVNRAGGAVATGNAGAAEELRLITDGLSEVASHGDHLLTISAGPTGSAAIVWHRDL